MASCFRDIGVPASHVERTAHNLLVEHYIGNEWFSVPLDVARDAVINALEMVRSGNLEFAKTRLPPQSWRSARAEIEAECLSEGVAKESFAEAWVEVGKALFRFEVRQRNIRLAAARAALEHARTARGVKVGRLPSLTGKRREAALNDWHHSPLSVKALAEKYGVAERTLYNEFGTRTGEPPPPRRKRRPK